MAGHSFAARGVAAISAGATAAAAAAGGWSVFCAADKKENNPSSLFDPEALERGAKALREIDSSSNAKQVLELTKQQEITKQLEAKKDEQKNAALAAQFAAVCSPQPCIFFLIYSLRMQSVVKNPL